MDSFELNKIIGALLGVVFVVFSVSLISGAIFSSEAPEEPGYAIEAQEEAGGGEAAKEEEPQDIAPLLADADVSAGENIFKRCHACHTVEQGGANKVGPNLWGIVNRPPASHEGFSYSAGMKTFAEEVKQWDYDHLNHFLTDPRGYVSGTAMSFAGLSDIQDRADVIAFLRQHAETPEPLPEPKAEPASDEGQAAEGGETGAKEGEGAAAGGEGEQAAPADEGGQNGDDASKGADEEGAAQDESGASQEQAPADSDAQAGSSGGNGSNANQAPGSTEDEAAPAAEDGSGNATQDGAGQDGSGAEQAPANDNEQQSAPADESQSGGSSQDGESAPAANDNEQPADDEQKPASGE